MFVNLEKVTKTYRKGENEIVAVKDLSFEIERGVFLCIAGVSGSGKSTLLGLMGGLDKPTSGNIIIDGVNLSALDSDGLAFFRREKVGFIFQTFNLIPTFTVFENVLLPLMPMKFTKAKVEERVASLLEKVEMLKRKDHFPGELSGGEQQRVAIARALVNSPPLLLADEPTGQLDTKTGERIVNLLKELNQQEGITVIIATHDPKLFSEAKDVVTLEDGMIKN
jgi:putative ABC transport system ATP-binding protein